MTNKRGRPVGAKNKTTIAKEVRKFLNPVDSFAETLKEWDRKEAEKAIEDAVDWQKIAHKQEERLSAYIAENEELAQICISRWEEIQHLKYLVKYLEGKHEDTSV